MSGGTALSSWYLNHRESYDLDFFCDTPLDYDRIMRWFHHNEQVIEYESIRFDQDYGFLLCFLRFKNNDVLKIDFHNYGVKSLQKGHRWHGLLIDSFYDITINKLRTIATAPRTRDYVDAYYIYQKTPFSLMNLLPDVHTKFHENIDALQLAKNFMKVAECVDMPIMRIPFERNNMIAFYTQLASKLRKEIFD